MMKYEVEVVTKDGQVLEILYIDPDQANWNCDRIKESTIQEIFNTIEADIKRRGGE